MERKTQLCPTCGQIMIEVPGLSPEEVRSRGPGWGKELVQPHYHCLNCGERIAGSGATITYGTPAVVDPEVGRGTFGFEAPVSPNEFLECETCRSKPGAPRQGGTFTPELCTSCLHNRDLIARLYRELIESRNLLAQPIPIRLQCPVCHELHIDKGAFAIKVHHTHACQHCGHVWRPAVVPTMGVQFLPSFKDED